MHLEGTARVDTAWLPLLAAALVCLGGAVRTACLGDGGLTAAETALPWCYSDVSALATSRGLATGLRPYLDVMAEYPPLTALQWWAAGALGGGVAGFLIWTTVVQAGAAALVLRVLHRVGVPRRWRWAVAAAPALAATGTLNWDLVPVALLVAGLAARTPGRAGTLLALGGLAKLFPLVAVAPAAWCRWREGDRGGAVRLAATAVTVFAVVQGAAAAWAPAGWDAYLVLNRERGVDWDTIWYALQALTGTPLPAANAIVALTVGGGWAVIGLARRDADAPTLTLLLLAWLLLAGKVWSPQFTLWVLPLLAWGRVPLRVLWPIVLADLAVVAVRFPFLAGQQGMTPSAPYSWFLVPLAIRWVLLAGVVVASLGAAPGRRPQGVPAAAGAKPPDRPLATP